MKSYIRKIMPQNISNVLWGNRKIWGLQSDENDSCWKEWQKTYEKFYSLNQREGVGARVNDAGYRVMKDIDLSGKIILEIGAGDISHLKYMNGVPEEYIIADNLESMMDVAKKKLKENSISYKSVFVKNNERLPIEDESVDVVLSFYSLEHLYPLERYLEDMFRVLKPGGMIVGAIPTEGAFAWGLGRALTTRRWIKKHTSIDYDKIICWEHPNFAETIVKHLNKLFIKKKIRLWPFSIMPLLDLNLVLSFKYMKSKD